MQNAISIPLIRHQLASLLLYQSVFKNEVGVAFLALLEELDRTSQSDFNNKASCLQAYGEWFHAIAAMNQSWQDFLVEQILQSDNPFTQIAQRSDFAKIPAALVNAAEADLKILQTLYRYDGDQISTWVQKTLSLEHAPVAWQTELSNPNLEQFSLHSSQNWATDLERLAHHYRQFGVGLFSQYRALRWQADRLVGIAYPDVVHPDDLVSYDQPRSQLVQNTVALLAGLPALHVLLYGSRGSGKSSLVKSLLTQFGDRGLRLVEVAKSELIHLPAIVDHLRQAPQKFILFVDDLSFEEEEDGYKALKVVLEGNLTARSQNVVVYATSNRRHLIREFHGDRPRPSAGDEIHAWDTVQEKLSLSDRFGLTLTFEPADQKTYLQIVHHLAHRANLSLSAEELDYQALQWATRHNGRSGRTARQFVDFLQAQHGSPSD